MIMKRICAPSNASDCCKLPKLSSTEFCGYSEEELRNNVPPDEAKLLETSSLTGVDALLARWWRRRSRDAPEGVKLDSASVSPSTRLRQISRCEKLKLKECDHKWEIRDLALKIYHTLAEAKKFLAYCILHLSHQLSEDKKEEDKFSICFTLAGCLHRLGCHREALDKIKIMLEIEEDPKVVWFSKLVERQIRYNDDRALRLVLASPEPVKLRTSVPVERRDASKLSLLEFYTSYANAHVPVVVTGLAQHMTQTWWTLDYIKSVIGSKVAPLKVLTKDSAEWAKLESAGSCPVAEFISSLSNKGESRYLFDWSLPLYAPELVNELTIPKYFANDFLQRVAGSDNLYHDSWPSLFIAPKGIISDMHVDSFGSNFWMALFQGKKRWTFFSQEDACCLYPQLDSSMDPTFEADFNELSLNKYPALSCVNPKECILCPGEVLFVPAGCPHKVENLETSLAISANFVDGSNFELVRKELRTNGLIDERSAKLLEMFSSEDFNSAMDFDISHLPWRKFKQYNS